MELEENKFSGSIGIIKKLEDELKGNFHALNELRQLHLLFEYYNERLTDKTNQLEKSNKELEKQTKRAEYLAKIGELASSLTHNLKPPRSYLLYSENN